MFQLTLPTSRRGHLYGFWLMESILAGSLVIIAAKAAGLPRSVLLGMGFAVAIAIAGLGQRKTISRFYELWNHWATSYGIWASRLLMKICYFSVFSLVGCAGSRLVRSRTSESLWVRRSSSAPEAYSSQSELSLAADSRSWIRTYVRWVAKSGNWWALSLLPFLILIPALDSEKSGAFPGNIYTLF